MMLTPRALNPVVAGVAQAPKYHREGGEAQVRFRLAAAGRKEEEVHGLAVRVERARKARQIQQDERELEGPPPGRIPRGELLAEALTERARDGAVRHPKGIECIVVCRQQRDALSDPVRSVAGTEQQPFRRVPSSSLKGIDRPPLPSNPGAVLVDQGSQGDLDGRAVVQCTEDLHRELDRGNVPRLRVLDASARDPGRSQPPTGAVDEVPVRRHPVTGCELGRVRVVKIGHLVVPVLGLRPPQVRSGHECMFPSDLDFGLEYIREVGVVLVRWAPVHQEDGDGPATRRDSGDSCSVDGPHLRVERKAAVIGNGIVISPCERDLFRCLVLPPLPHRCRLAFGIRNRHQSVVGPPYGH